MSNYLIIKRAIETRSSITCVYKGYSRHMSPHLLGVKNSRQKVLLLQYGGGSSQGLSKKNEENWRCLFVSDLSNIIINSDEFHTASNHSIEQTCVDEIHIEIAY